MTQEEKGRSKTRGGGFGKKVIVLHSLGKTVTLVLAHLPEAALASHAALAAGVRTRSLKSDVWHATRVSRQRRRRQRRV